MMDDGKVALIDNPWWPYVTIASLSHVMPHSTLDYLQDDSRQQVKTMIFEGIF